MADRDEHFMRMALRLAARARGRTSPNPMVGAVIVRRGRVVGRGHHARAGDAHAEVVAIADAGRAAHGADMYVNLEPCNHQGRTGPCARAIIEAGVSRVVVGMRDPNPLVNGKGIAALRRKGVRVTTGVLEAECRRLNESFSCYIVEGRPFVTLKSAVTLDGRVATRGGDSRWVTGEQARRRGHRLRATNDCIMVGVGTVLADDPTLTCRGVRGGRDPVRVVVDARLRTPPDANVVRAAGSSCAPTWIVAGARAPRTRAAALEAAGAVVLRMPGVRGGGLPLDRVLELLARRELASVLLEGGPRLAGSFWDAGLVDRVVAFVAPKILGDARALPMLRAAPVEAMEHATDLEELEVRRVGADIMVTGRPRGRGGAR